MSSHIPYIMPTGITKRFTPKDFMVADLRLSEFGRKEIEIAEHEMPGLISIKKKYSSLMPLNGVRITGSLPVSYTHLTLPTICSV